MGIGTILVDLHSRLFGLDDLGNAVLKTKGQAASWKSTSPMPDYIGDGIATSVAISNAKGASANITNVTFQVTDYAGVPVAGVFDLDIILSDASTGAGLTATTASGGIAALASSGVVLSAMVASKAIRVQTLATGAFVLAITDTAKTLFYPVASLGGRASIVGGQLTTASYD
jgi:hypothetical protein